MAKFTRIEVALKMAEKGLVPVFYHKELEVCKQVVKACYEGGIRVLEFTDRGDFAHEVFLSLIKFVNDSCPDMILGIGSVADAGTASLYIQLGANFVVSPALKEDVALTCNRRKIMYAPGCGTVTEISKAEELGVEIVKIFPASLLGGPKFVAAIKGPCPWTSIMATGGVGMDEESLRAWFNAGVQAVGMSQLVASEDITNNNYENIKTRCRKILDIIQKIQRESIRKAS